MELCVEIIQNFHFLSQFLIGANKSGDSKVMSAFPLFETASRYQYNTSIG
jgi:hypothetical protein